MGNRIALQRRDTPTMIEASGASPMPARRRRHGVCNRRFCSVLLVAIAMTASTAQAHALLEPAAPFWSGILHFLVTPLALAAVLGLIIIIVDAPHTTLSMALMVAAAGTFIAMQLPPAGFQPAAAIGVAAVGILAALGRHPPAWLIYVGAVVSGVAAGLSISLGTGGWGAGFGAAVMSLLLASWGSTALLRLQSTKLAAAMPAARRWLGVAIAATALMIGTRSLTDTSPFH